MPKVSIVIGANYGDEGKGLVTDYLAMENTTVIRFNGGAQAGHTVCTDHHRHEFHHVGAGAFQGAKTHLSRFFISNPILFMREIDQLSMRIPIRVVTVDPFSKVTTPYEMLLNQSVETKRGGQRHGSCGVGINETVTREENGYHLRAHDLFALSEDQLLSRMFDLRNTYLPVRAEAIGVGLPEFSVLDAWDLRFLTAVQFFKKHAKLSDDGDALLFTKHLVFEGAQGLGLDEIRGVFPHVTRSRTGLTNITTMLEPYKAIVQGGVEVIYVTRSYLTRHGNGPLDRESKVHPGGWTGPETNVSNEWQGNFRYAPLNWIELRERIEADLNEAYDNGILKPIPQLAVTCLDQGVDCDPHKLGDLLGLPLKLSSFGPTRGHVKEAVIA